MATLRFEDRGKLIDGLFYFLFPDISAKSPDGLRFSMIESVHPKESRLVSATVVDTRETVEYECGTSKSHVSGKNLLAVDVNLVSGSAFGDVIVAEGYFIINESIANDLSKTSLIGTDSMPVKVVESEIAIEPPRLRCLAFAGKNALRPRTIDPPEENRCFACGHGPLFCQECGFGKLGCMKCGEEVFVTEKDHRGDSDPRILIERPSGLPAVVDLHRWDGSDFFGGGYGIVSNRALDFLLRKHIAPFRALALRTDITRMDDRLRKMVDRSRKPLD